MSFIKDELKVIREKDPSLKSGFEIILYPSFWAVFFYRGSHKLYKRKKYFMARLVSQFARFVTGIEIHPGARIGKNFFIDHGMGVVIGETCKIGDNVLIYQGATLGGTGKETGKRHPTIGNNVMIGSGAKILGPFKVGDNARIGAGTVVLQEVPANSTVVGVPGKPIIRKSQINTHPSDCLEQCRMPDPIQMEICGLKNKIKDLEGRINQIERN